MPAGSERVARSPAAAWLPSARSLLAGLAIAAAASGLYLVARETSVFAIERIEVRGAAPVVAARVQQALRPLAGTSLVAFDAQSGNRRLASVPLVASASYDRDFPHTLRVTVVAEQPIALLRRGHDSWIVAESGRVLRRVSERPLPGLPRVWLPAAADPLVGAVILGEPAEAVRALSELHSSPLVAAVRSIRVVGGELTVTLATGTDILLGSASRLPLKLAVAARVLPLAEGAGWIDVSVPERAVAGNGPPAQPQVESRA